MGGWQLEGYGELERERASGKREEVTGFALSRGMAEGLEVIVGAPWFRNGADSIGDVTLDVKWRFLARGPFSFAFMPGVSLPTGDESELRGTGKLNWGGLLIASWEQGPLAVNAQAGYRRRDNEIGLKDSQSELATAVLYRVAQVRWFGEAVFRSAPLVGGESARYAALGAIWSVRRDFDLALGWRSGHGGALISDGWLFGATVRW